MILSADPPATAAKVVQLRPSRTQRLIHMSAYQAAQYDPSRHNWQRGIPRSADADTLPEREALVSRSRDAVRNDPTALRAITSKVSNVISTGPVPQAALNWRALGISQEQAREIRAEQEAAWALWAEECDASGRLPYGGFCQLTYRTQEVSGESLTQFATIDQPGRISPLALYAIDPDRLASPGGKFANPKIRDGIELGEWDRPLAYYIREAHPADLYVAPRGNPRQVNRIAASDPQGRPLILHLYHVDRAAQSRGVPTLSPVLTRLKDLSDYLEAEIQSMIAAGSVVWSKTTELPDDPDYFGADGLDATDERGTYLEDIEPLSVYNLRPGETMNLHSSDRPGNNFEAFVKSIKRVIAAGVNQPYELISADFSDANYSNLRGALLEARRYFQMDQHDFINRWCKAVWRRVMEDLYLRGLWGKSIPPARFYANPRAWLAVIFLPVGWSWVDPRNEAISAEIELRNRLTTHRRIFAARGEDAEEQFEIMAEERDILDGLDLPYPLPAQNPIGPDEPEEESSDGAA